MAVFESVRRWFGRILEQPVRNLSRTQRAVLYAFELGRHGARELKRNRANQMAAALTFRTLFSLLPMAALILVVVHAFLGPDDQSRLKESVVTWALGPMKSAAAAGPVDGDEPRAEFEGARQALDERVESVLVSVEQTDFGSIGVVGLLLFIYAATGLLATVERSFNTIYAASYRRKWSRRLPIHYTVLTLGPVLLWFGIWLREQFLGLLEAGGVWTDWLVSILIVLSPLLTTWLVLLVMYVTIPNVRVAARPAAIGSLVAALAIGVTAEGFRIYLSHAALSTLYGALALLPLFLLWIYLVWLIVLFGLNIAFTVQTGSKLVLLGQRARRDDLEVGVADWAIPLAAEVATRFHHGRRCGVFDLAEALGRPHRIVQAVLDRLAAAGILLTVEYGRQTGYTLARPAERIEVSEVVEAVSPPRKGLEGEGELPGWGVVDEIRRAGLAVAATKTLADLVEADEKHVEDDFGSDGVS